MERHRNGKQTVNSLVEALAQEAIQNGTCLLGTSGTLSSALSIRRQSGELVSPRRGMYAPADLWNKLDARQRHLWAARTIGSQRPDRVFCHVTAALAYNLNVTLTGAFGTDIEVIHVVAGNREHGRLQNGIRCHNITDAATWRAEGIPVTSPARTVFDCARSLSFPDALAIADAALRSGLTNRDEFLGLIDENAGAHGIAKARKVLEHANALAESGGESLLRAGLIELGYKTPELQVTFKTPLGDFFRVDLLARREDGSAVALEMDGRIKYEDPAMTRGRDHIGVLLDERQREAALTACNLQIMRVRYRDLVDDRRLTKLCEAYRLPKAHVRSR